MKSFCYIAMLLAVISLSMAATASTKALNDTAISADNEPMHATSSERLWNLQDADILSVINEVSLETGKNFVVDPRVSGKISLISSKPIHQKEVYHVFLSILELLGYSAIPSGNVVKIVPNMESGEFATKVVTSKAPGKGDEVVVRVIPLENISANQLIPIVRPMMPQWSNISAYTPGNILILLGRAANLQRIANVIKNIDQSAANQIDMISLKRAPAGQIATVLTNLQNAARAMGDTPQVSVAADERSNSILLSGNKAARAHMKLLIAQLDEPKLGKQGNTKVVYLRYLKAKNVAPVIGKIAQNMLGKADTNAGAMASPKSKEAPEENITNIQAEPSTNALIITASPSVMPALDSVIAKLDVRPAQVLVEGIIVELDQTDLKDLGILWGMDQSGLPNPSGNNPNGFVPGTFGIIPNQQIQSILSALQNKTGVDILSTPSIVVLDNQDGILSVGKDVPEQTGSYMTNSSSLPFNTVGRRSVALTLKVNPQINLGTAVRLRLALQNDTLQDPDNPGLNPIVNTSKIQNSVIINSQDILVLGGLVSNNMTERTDKIPLIGDIPIVGTLFQHKARKIEKKNLMVFIKPTILHNNQDVSGVTSTKYNTIRNTQINGPLDLSHVAEQKRQNILPLWKNNVKLPQPFQNDNEANR